MPINTKTYIPELERKINDCNRQIAELEKFCVDNFNWDNATPEAESRARKLHMKYYPENYEQGE